MKGWRTYFYSAGIAIVGVLEAFDFTQIFTGPNRGVALLGTALGIAVLRSITNTPPTCNGCEKKTEE